MDIDKMQKELEDAKAWLDSIPEPEQPKAQARHVASCLCRIGMLAWITVKHAKNIGLGIAKIASCLCRIVMLAWITVQHAKNIVLGIAKMAAAGDLRGSSPVATLVVWLRELRRKT